MKQRTLLVSLAAISAGCGSSQRSDGAGATLATGGAGAAASSGAGGGGGSAGNAGSTTGASGIGTGGAGKRGSAGAPAARGHGQVSLVSLGNVLYGHAVFYAPDYSSPCTAETIGDCKVTTCPGSLGGQQSPEAGMISITSTDADYQVTLLADAMGSYGSQNKTGVAFSGKESVSFSATGGAVPAFAGTMSAPVALILSSPLLGQELPEGGFPALRSEDLVLGWGGGDDGVVAQVQAEQSINGEYLSLACVADSTLGTLTIPTAALSALAAGTGLVLLTIGRSSLSVDPYDVDLLVAGGIYAGDGTTVGFTLR